MVLEAATPNGQVDAEGVASNSVLEVRNATKVFGGGLLRRRTTVAVDDVRPQNTE